MVPKESHPLLWLTVLSIDGRRPELFWPPGSLQVQRRLGLKGTRWRVVEQDTRCLPPTSVPSMGTCYPQVHIHQTCKYTHPNKIPYVVSAHRVLSAPPLSPLDHCDTHEATQTVPSPEERLGPSQEVSHWLAGMGAKRAH